MSNKPPEDTGRFDQLRTIQRSFEGTIGQSLEVAGVDPNNVREVADVGVGNFTEAKVLRERFPGAQIWGFDRKVDPLLKNKVLIPSDVNVVEEDVLTPESEFSRRKYDLIVVRNPDLRNPPNWERVFAACAERLNDYGLIVVTVEHEIELDEVANMLSGLEVRYKGVNASAMSKDVPSVAFRDDFLLVTTKK